MRADVRNALVAATVLAAFALAGTALVTTAEHSTRARIADNERQALLESLALIVDPARYDNDPLADTIQLADVRLGDGPITVFRARRADEPVAAVFAVTAPDGYAGPIRILVAVNVDGTVSGVRVIAHRETPGLGDPIDASRSDWIHTFAGRSLGDPPRARWTVRKDGGAFDQFTGATITPRTVVHAVRRALEFFEENQEALFATSN
ncbi:MAG: electron transport complex subunit RsxG [Gammaproteobacteria bacterium]